MNKTHKQKFSKLHESGKNVWQYLCTNYICKIKCVVLLVRYYLYEEFLFPCHPKTVLVSPLNISATAPKFPQYLSVREDNGYQWRENTAHDHKCDESTVPFPS